MATSMFGYQMALSPTRTSAWCYEQPQSYKQRTRSRKSGQEKGLVRVRRRTAAVFTPPRPAAADTFKWQVGPRLSSLASAAASSICNFFKGAWSTLPVIPLTRTSQDQSCRKTDTDQEEQQQQQQQHQRRILGGPDQGHADFAEAASSTIHSNSNSDIIISSKNTSVVATTNRNPDSDESTITTATDATTTTTITTSIINTNDNDDNNKNNNDNNNNTKNSSRSSSNSSGNSTNNTNNKSNSNSTRSRATGDFGPATTLQEAELPGDLLDGLPELAPPAPNFQADDKPTVLLVDGHYLAYRSYFRVIAHGGQPLRTTQGVPTTITYAFLRGLLRDCWKLQPDSVLVAFDSGKRTFRHTADVKYKAHRPPAPAGFGEDLANLKQLLRDGLGLMTVEVPTFEGDDVLGSLARLGSEAGWRVVIMSGDRDIFQLVDDEKDIVCLYLAPKSAQDQVDHQLIMVQEKEVEEMMGVPPKLVPDLKALIGDRSDGFGGVPGIGQVRGTRLLKSFPGLETLYEALEVAAAPKRSSSSSRDEGRFSAEQLRCFTPATKRYLVNGRQEAFHCLTLATIRKDIEFENLQDVKPHTVNITKLASHFARLEFNSFLPKLGHFARAFARHRTLHWGKRHEDS